MRVEEFLNENNYRELKKWHDNFMKQVYYSQRGYFLQKHMELDEFKSEVYVMLIRFWNFENFRGTLKTYLGRVTENTMLHIYTKMDRKKNRLNYDDTVERFDKEVGEDEEPLDVPVYDDYFNERRCIEYVVECAETYEDREILRLYLSDISKSEIARKLGLNRDYVRYRIDKKYMKKMQKRFNEYNSGI